MSESQGVSRELHPELSVGRFLPRGLGTPFWIWLLRRLPYPRVKLPAALTKTERRVDAASAVEVTIISPRLDGSLRPAMLWIHGGGYVIGSPKQDLATCARYAERLGMVVVAVDYRLAPEHPFPTPLEDCFSAFELMHREAAQLGIDPARIVIAGASAGGGLAAALTQLVHDRGRPAPLMQLLIYPMLDDRTVKPELERSYFRLWNLASNRVGWRAYLGSTPGREVAPEHAVPGRREDLRGLPPTWIGVGTLDLFYEEDLDYAARLTAAGVPVTVEVVDGAFHAFEAVLPTKAPSRRFVEAQVAALAQRLAEAGVS